jgi:hypothetical protein
MDLTIIMGPSSSSTFIWSPWRIIASMISLQAGPILVLPLYGGEEENRCPDRVNSVDQMPECFYWSQLVNWKVMID